MAEITWIKLVTNIYTNKKINQIRKMKNGDSFFTVWICLMCIAGEANDNGNVVIAQDVPYTEEMLASETNEPIGIINDALSLFERFKMIVRADGVIKLINWDKYQNTDGMERIKEQARRRVAEYRERHSEKASGNGSVTECNVTSNVTSNVTRSVTSNVTSNAPVTQCNATDKDKEKEKEKEKEEEEKETTQRKTAPRFTPPTLDEVRAYCEERGNGIDAEQFIDHYNSNGWKVGRSPMKDWKAAVRNWEKNEYRRREPGKEYGPNGIELAPYDPEDPLNGLF